MKIPAKTIYACRALMELALHWPNHEPLGINIIAKKQKIPLKFLTHILIQLKSYGFVDSIRGQRGGYLLIVPPKEISLGDIVRGFSGQTRLPRKINAGGDATGMLFEIFTEAQKAYESSLNMVTLEDIINRQSQIKSVPMYTI